MFSYLQFLLKSTNEHGVHSPFVFNYITKGLYQQKQNTTAANKTNKWVMLTLNYFNPKTIYFLTNDFALATNESIIKKKTNSTNAAFIVANFNTVTYQSLTQAINTLTNDQLLLITYNTYPKKFLNDIKSNSEITLVIDFYYGCLLSKRTEQPKQNFRIRF
ncbi:hypothetical protein P3875_06050 [Myroides sp. JBRI-B21084]|uniref:hypothetical protein n=1 Tax=Myroides sp. JBRI-B21084 TaxID=3119977 RepID=UPI0026E38B03|nr:hypothetical protein [Paenimyroides cloacae]WKW47615.1 hypothetical protein P3875_06050 [Paenimyroides cloacae]